MSPLRDAGIGAGLPAFESLAMCERTADGRVFAANDAFLRLTGYQVDDLATGRIEWNTIAPPAEAEATATERPLVRCDGGRRFVSIGESSGPDGRVSAYLIDVDPHKRAELDAVASRRQLRAVIDAEPACVKLVDRDGLLLDMNPAGLAICAAPALATLIGQAVVGLVAPEHRAAYQEFNRRVCDGERTQLVFEIIALDDTRHWMESHGAPLLLADGRTVNLSVTREVTEQRRAAEALRISEARYRSVVDNLKEVVFQTDSDGRWSFLNPAWTEVTGFPLADSLGTPALDYVHPDDRELEQQLRQALLAREKAYCRHELRYRHRDGGFRWIEVFARLTPSADDTVLGMSGTLTDVTERKTLEDRLQIADRMASVGTLAAGVAHEINNPLAAVVANLQIALDDLGAPGPSVAEQRELLDDCLLGALRIRDIVRDLKIFSRADHHQEVHRIDVRHVLETTLRMASNEVRHRARLEVEFGEVPLVDASEARLGQVFLNLIVNAAQAIPEGNIAGNLIRVTTGSDPRGHAVIEVHDSGAGMSAAVARRVFDPFFTTKPVGVGTGLGLSICHRLVSEVGGDIGLTSAPGHGSVFRVSLPPAAGAAATAEPVVTARIAPAERRRILVVDDDPSIARTLRRALPDHEMVTVPSGGEALRLLGAGERFDLVLCDVMMPQMTGLEVHAAMRTIAIDQAERTIFMTGGVFSPQLQAELDRLPNLCIDKPFDLDRLRRMIATPTSALSSAPARAAVAG